jgi:hypothetical protein
VHRDAQPSLDGSTTGTHHSEGSRTIAAATQDFGLSKDSTMSHPKTYCGTISYMAPVGGYGCLLEHSTFPRKACTWQ